VTKISKNDNIPAPPQAKKYDAFGDKIDAKSPGKETLGGGKKPKVD
jgi:hypothetical protein